MVGWYVIMIELFNNLFCTKLLHRKRKEKYFSNKYELYN